MLSSAAETTAAAVMPNFSKSSVYCALAPKCSSETMRPASPTTSRQPWATPASTLTRARTSGGSTLSR